MRLTALYLSNQLPFSVIVRIYEIHGFDEELFLLATFCYDN